MHFERYAGWAARAAGVLLLVICPPGLLLAQQTQPSSPLSLREAVNIALEKNPERKAALAEARVASAEVREARSFLLPHVTFTETATRSNDPVYVFGSKLRQRRFTTADFALNVLNTPAPFGNYTTRFGGTWNLFDSLASWRAVHRAERIEEAAGQQLERTDQQIVFRAVDAYYGVLLARKQLEVAEQAMKTAQAILDRSKDRFESGVIVESDFLSAQVRLSRPDRSGIEELANLKLPGASGGLVSLREVTSVRQTTIDTSVYRKNLRPVAYVTGDVAGEIESPVYAILKMSEALNKIQLPEGFQVKQYSGTTLPESTHRLSMKWDGEWHITVEVFRDLGLAFAAVLVLIYVLVVGWFRSFKTPLVIMALIPLTLVGILPAHALMGAFFTATSMIGFIAGAGIIVRNSIILVDFIELRRAHGMSLEEAVVDAGAVRFRPMLLTAAAVVVGASVILFDPIFQGLAISLMAGEIASTVLSRMTVPVLYYLSERNRGPVVPTAGGSLSAAIE